MPISMNFQLHTGLAPRKANTETVMPQNSCSLGGHFPGIQL